MARSNLLVISNSFPNRDDSFVGNIFVKEQVRYLKNFFKTVSVVSPVAYGVNFLRSTSSTDYLYEDISVFFPRYLNVPFFYSRGRSLWVSLETRAILSVIEKQNIPFDIIHAHMTWPSGAVAAELKKRFNVPLVITEHTSATFYNAAKRKDAYWKRTFQAADAIVRVREGDNSLFEELDVPLEKVYAIPNGFDHEKFYPMPSASCREQLALPVDRKIVLNVGNLYSPVKGHRIFIKAISQVAESRGDVLGIVVGSGKLETELLRYIQELHMEDHVRLVGSKPHDQIPFWLNACDVFVLPSLNEGNPTVMFEVLGCGKPFVGTSVGGVPGVITSEDYGLLVNPGDPDALAEQIELALKREWDRDAILQYAARYNWENIGKELADVYSKVLLEPNEP
jgi:glycosyltransferase involved in cell wall biosynthesis